MLSIKPPRSKFNIVVVGGGGKNNIRIHSSCTLHQRKDKQLNFERDQSGSSIFHILLFSLPRNRAVYSRTTSLISRLIRKRTIVLRSSNFFLFFYPLFNYLFPKDYVISNLISTRNQPRFNMLLLFFFFWSRF